MPSVTTQVISVERKDSGWIEVSAADGNTYATKKPEIGNRAFGFQGQTVTIEYTAKQKGQYTNYYIEAIELAGSVQAAPAAINSPSVPVAAGITAAQKDERIMRGNALNATAALLGPLVSTGYFDNGEGKIDSGRLCGSVVALAGGLVNFLRDGTGPVGQTVNPVVVEQTPQAVAAFVQSQGGEVAVGAQSSSLPEWL